MPFLRIAALAVSLLAAGPALAFDELRMDLALIPADPAANWMAFQYSAPNRAGLPQQTVFPSSYDIANAFIQPGPAWQKTGIDFSKATSLFETGAPPQQISVLHGAPGFTDDAATTLAANGFETIMVDDTPVLSHGVDFTMDFANRANGDPFSGNLGRSYRIAFAPGYAVVAFGTDIIGGALAQLADQEGCDGCRPWRDIVDGIEAAAGSGATLEGAVGFPVTAVTLRPEATPAEQAHDLPPYDLVIFALTRTDGHASIHIALNFTSTENASKAIKTLSRRLEADAAGIEADSPLANATVSGTLSRAAIGGVATLTVDFPDPNTAVLAYTRWLGSVMSGEFSILAL